MQNNEEEPQSIDLQKYLKNAQKQPAQNLLNNVPSQYQQIQTQNQQQESFSHMMWSGTSAHIQEYYRQLQTHSFLQRVMRFIAQNYVILLVLCFVALLVLVPLGIFATKLARANQQVRYESQEIIQNGADPNSYVFLQLKNNIRILLISDQTSENAGISLSIQTKGLEDAAFAVPGLMELIQMSLLKGKGSSYSHSEQEGFVERVNRLTAKHYTKFNPLQMELQSSSNDETIQLTLGMPSKVHFGRVLTELGAYLKQPSFSLPILKQAILDLQVQRQMRLQQNDEAFLLNQAMQAMKYSNFNFNLTNINDQEEFMQSQNQSWNKQFPDLSLLNAIENGYMLSNPQLKHIQRLIITIYENCFSAVAFSVVVSAPLSLTYLKEIAINAFSRIALKNCSHFYNKEHLIFAQTLQEPFFKNRNVYQKVIVYQALSNSHIEQYVQQNSANKQMHMIFPIMKHPNSTNYFYSLIDFICDIISQSDTLNENLFSDLLDMGWIVEPTQIMHQARLIYDQVKGHVVLTLTITPKGQAFLGKLQNTIFQFLNTLFTDDVFWGAQNMYQHILMSYLNEVHSQQRVIFCAQANLKSQGECLKERVNKLLQARRVEWSLFGDSLFTVKAESLQKMIFSQLPSFISNLQLNIFIPSNCLVFINDKTNLIDNTENIKSYQMIDKNNLQAHDSLEMKDQEKQTVFKKKSKIRNKKRKYQRKKLINISEIQKQYKNITFEHELQGGLEQNLVPLQPLPIYDDSEYVNNESIKVQGLYLISPEITHFNTFLQFQTKSKQGRRKKFQPQTNNKNKNKLKQNYFFSIKSISDLQAYIQQEAVTYHYMVEKWASNMYIPETYIYPAETVSNTSLLSRNYSQTLQQMKTSLNLQNVQQMQQSYGHLLGLFRQEGLTSQNKFGGNGMHGFGNLEQHRASAFSTSEPQLIFSQVQSPFKLYMQPINGYDSYIGADFRLQLTFVNAESDTNFIGIKDQAAMESIQFLYHKILCRLFQALVSEQLLQAYRLNYHFDIKLLKHSYVRNIANNIKRQKSKALNQTDENIQNDVNQYTFELEFNGYHSKLGLFVHSVLEVVLSAQNMLNGNTINIAQIAIAIQEVKEELSQCQFSQECQLKDTLTLKLMLNQFEDFSLKALLDTLDTKVTPQGVLKYVQKNGFLIGGQSKMTLQSAIGIYMAPDHFFNFDFQFKQVVLDFFQSSVVALLMPYHQFQNAKQKQQKLKALQIQTYMPQIPPTAQSSLQEEEQQQVVCLILHKQRPMPPDIKDQNANEILMGIYLPPDLYTQQQQQQYSPKSQRKQKALTRVKIQAYAILFAELFRLFAIDYLDEVSSQPRFAALKGIKIHLTAVDSQQQDLSQKALVLISLNVLNLNKQIDSKYATQIVSELMEYFVWNMSKGTLKYETVQRLLRIVSEQSAKLKQKSNLFSSLGDYQWQQLKRKMKSNESAVAADMNEELVQALERATFLGMTRFVRGYFSQLMKADFAQCNMI